MPTLELKLRRRPAASREPVAWYVPSGAPADWVAEAVRWPVRHEAIRIVAVRGEGDRVAGALLIPGEGETPAEPRGVSFGRLIGRVYLPADSDWYPAVSENEMQEIFSPDYLSVWVPGWGLTAAEPDDCLSLADLLTPPESVDRSYDAARPGLGFASRLVGVMAAPLDSADSILADGHGDIGDQSGDLGELPRSPGESPSGLAGAAGRAAMTAAALPLFGLSKLGSALGRAFGGAAGSAGGTAGGYASTAGGAGGGGWDFGAFGDMANRLMQRVSQSLENHRHREIGRLLHLLETDPDQGLRYALPFGGDAHRGLANPGGRLSERNVDFRLGGGGGGPADIWDLPARFQQDLIAKYRDLAARETRLGRHRRAAYIYAQLLGDYRAAASALEQGRHYREAAVLYRERLNDEHAAARCLEEGGVWEEAIAAHRGLGNHEKVGDLLTQLDRHDEATESFQLAAARYLDSANQLEAARIQEKKLGDAPLALETLDAGWPHTNQAERCVAAAFDLCGRRGLHDDAQERIERLHEDAERNERYATVVEWLVNAGDAYPEPSVQGRMRSVARRAIAVRLRSANHGEAERLARCLPRLVPEDRLLARDTRRFIDRQTKPKRITRQRPTQTLRVVAEADLELAGVWRAATTIGDHVYVSGVMEGRVVFSHCDPEGKVRKKYRVWPDRAVPLDTDLLLLGNRSPLSLLTLGLGIQFPETQVFTQADGAYEGVSVRTPTGHGHVWGASLGALQQTWAIETHPKGIAPILVCTHCSGSVISTLSLDPELPDDWSDWADLITPVPMHATSQRVLLGFGRYLISVRGERVETVDTLAETIHGIYGSPPYASPTVAVATDSGAWVYQFIYGGQSHRIAEEMEQPRLLVNPGGFIAAADSQRVEVYRLARGPVGSTPRLVGTLSHGAGTPIKVVPTSQTDRLRVVTEQGKVLTIEIGK